MRKDVALGLTAPHGFSVETWSSDSNSVDITMIAGGLTATYLNDDCWPDIVFAGGDATGVTAYLNGGLQAGFTEDASLLAGTVLARAVVSSRAPHRRCSCTSR